MAMRISNISNDFQNAKSMLDNLPKKTDNMMLLWRCRRINMIQNSLVPCG